MILTGKAKEDFEEFFDNYSQQHHEGWWLENDQYLDEVNLPNGILYGIIIDWLDTAGIYVVIERAPFRIKSWFYRHEDKKYHYDTRQEATKAAIEKANEIFNKRKEKS